jgi:hypothetical protein
VVFALDMSGDHIFAACSDSWQIYGGLSVVDVGVPTAPSEVAFHRLRFGAQNVAVAGNFAAVTNYDQLVVLDVSNSLAPIRASTYRVPDWPGAMAFDGERLHLALPGAGLAVLDLAPCEDYVPPPRHPDGRPVP